MTTLVLANIQDPTYLYELMLAPGPDVLEKLTGAAGASALAGAEALCVEAGIAFDREIASGDPAPVLIQIAERLGCDAIILGARGLGPLRSAILGSVSQAILQTSRIPVTVVKHIRASSDLP
jgi:nucleotide-binding universal stress UspA family protein